MSPSLPGVPDATRNCGKCGAEIGADKKFCSKCGTAISLVSAAPFQSDVTCPQCGSAIKTGTKFCINCGARSVTSAPIRAACLGCGAELASDAQFCSNCGTPRTISSPQPLSCPQCRAPLKANARFCSSCGAAVVEFSSPLPLSSKLAPSELPALQTVTESWQLPPWPLDLKPPPPPARGVTHIFSIAGKDARGRVYPVKIDRPSKQRLRCSKCQEPLLPDKKFCSACGARMEATARSRRCPTCGKEVPSGKKFCTADGTPVPI